MIRRFVVLTGFGLMGWIALGQEKAMTFRNVTASSGVRFTHNNGATGKKYLPETLGPGVAFIDFDTDGRQDLLFVNGKNWVPSGARTTMQLYRNGGNGTFTDVTRGSGLDVDMYGLGAAVGDYDNDGRDDLFVTAVGQSRLFRNLGNGRFSDVTRPAGLFGVEEFSTSAAWLDFDLDGRLDLAVANYVEWSPEKDVYCSLDGTRKSYCTPESYKGASPRLWRGRTNGTFEDATKRAGLADPSAKSLGVTVADLNRDGLPDIIFANDTQPNKLYLNQRGGAFVERAVVAGIAFNEDGVARAGMGIDTADYDRSGFPSIAITNFSNQMLALYHNEGKGLFIDEAPRSEVGRASLLTLGFACLFFDYDLDGWPDLFVANGHIDADIEKIQSRIKFAQPPHLFRNLASGKFQDVVKQMGDLAAPRVARGAATADIDGDGDLDLVITSNGGRADVLRNEGGANRSLRVRLQGTQSNRNGIGAVVEVTAANGRQWQMLRSGSSYLSQSELVLTFGLGSATKADVVEVRWPSGGRSSLTNVASGVVDVVEGKP